MHIDAADLQEFVTQLFCKAGLPPNDAAIVSDCLVQANLRGVDSHGVARIPIYIERLQRGLVKAKPKLRRTQLRPGVTMIDGDNGMGPVVGREAIMEAIALAKTAGISAVGVCRSNHFGIATYYLKKAVDANLIGVALTNANPAMAPFGGRRPFWGTNPIAVGAPAGSHPPLIIDLATSVVARGKIFLASQENKSIPVGWALDSSGQSTTDPEKALQGALLPLGGAKGSALAMLVDIFAGVLTGAGFGPSVKDMYKNLQEPQDIGHFFLAIDIQAFMPIESFTVRLDTLIEALKATPTAEGYAEILAPGEIEARTEDSRKKFGIPLGGEILAELRQVAQVLLVPFPKLFEG